MRADPIQFAQANQASGRRPRCVVAILYDTGSLYCTSHDDIPNVPGVVLDSVIQSVSAISQKLTPDEGKSEIGAFDFTLVDLNGVFTDAIRTRVQDGVGLRDRVVKLYVGYEGFDFTAFQLFQTQVIKQATFNKGIYSVQCADITRQQQTDIMDPVSTTLRDSVSATDTVIPVYDTTKFLSIQHGTSWSDAPGQNCAYIRLEDEIIRWTGKTTDRFTGCARGVLNTLAIAHAVDDTETQDQRQKLDEHIYIELPAVKIALLVLLGTYGGVTFPPHWQLGFSSDFVRVADFEKIGIDLFDPANDNAGLVLLFNGQTKDQGQQFLEEEIFLLLGCYSPVYSDGAVGLRRMVAVLADAPAVATLTEDNIVTLDGLVHELDSLHNIFLINWDYDPVKDDFTRQSAWADADSINENGASELATYDFKGLHGSRHTDVTVAQRLDAIRDRYAYPPVTLQTTVFGSLDRLEIGDIVRARVASMRDFTNTSGPLNRSFEIQQQSYDLLSGLLQLNLFGSTFRPSPIPTGTVDGNPSPLPDAFYTSDGTDLSTILTVTAGLATAGSFTLNGATGLNDSAAIFYFDGDLTIPSGCDLTITGNVQIRIRGFLTFNGTLSGDLGGKDGVADSLALPWDTVQLGVAGYVGNSRAYDGVNASGDVFLNDSDPAAPPLAEYAATIASPVTVSLYPSFPQPVLSFDSSTLKLSGLPLDLRGAGGGPGGRVVRPDQTIAGFGGTGGVGGSGLCFICRGMSLGVSAHISLNGGDTSSPDPVFTQAPFEYVPGAGGVGGNGAMLIVLDGDLFTPPDISLKFFAVSGQMTQAGQAFDTIGSVQTFGIPGGWCGFSDPAVVNGGDFSNSAHQIVHVPHVVAPQTTADSPPPAPTGLLASPGAGFNSLHIAIPDFDSFDTAQIWSSLDNNRANAVLVGQGKQADFQDDLPILAQRFYWSRTVRTVDGGLKLYSDWFPLSPTAGVSATTLNPGGWTPIARGNCLATVSTIQKSNGTTAWDSDTFSLEAYAIGAYVSFRPGQTNLAFMIGLNADPVTDENFPSIDFAWYCGEDGNLEIFESGTTLGTFGSYDTSTVLAITYDSQKIRYFKNGSIQRSIAAASVPLRLDSSFYDPGAMALDVKFGPSPPAGLNGVDGADGAAGADGKDASFYDTFDHQDWASKYNNRANGGSVVVTYPTDGVAGGRVLKATGGQLWIASKDNIPFDPAGTYKITTKVRRTAASGNNLNQHCYVGVEGVAADGTTLINIHGANDFGSQHYVCIGGDDLGAIPLNQWVDAVGFFSGNASSGFSVSPDVNTPTPLYTGVRYFRPVLILNYEGGDGAAECNFIKVERMPTVGTAQMDPGAATAVYIDENSSQNVGFTNAAVCTVNVDPVAVDCLAIATAVFDMVINAGSFGGSAYVYSPELGISTGNCSISAGAPITRCTVQQQFSLAAGQSITVSLMADSSDITGTRLTVSNAVLQVEVVKR